MTPHRFILVCLLLPSVSAFSWTTNDIQFVLDVLPSGVVHQHEMLEMRDGARLSTHYFLPPGYQTQSYPVVLLRSAYNWWPDWKRYADDIVDLSDPDNPVYKNTNGYVYVIQNLRGDGDSESGTEFEPRLSDNEINDTYDTVESIATNSWCNGRVGMYGGSGHGMAAYMGWFSKAPHLTVVAPGNTGPNLYEHWSFENGVRRWIYDWLKNRNPNGTPMPEWPKPTLGEYCTHADWQAILATGAVSNNTILIHDADAWHNFFLDSTFEVFGAMTDDNHGYLVMNSGTHQGDQGLDFPNPGTIRTKQYLPSFLEILDGATITNRTYLDYYVMGDARRANAAGNFYRETESWPPPAIRTPYYMHADGTLSADIPTSTTTSLSYDYSPTNPVPTVGGNYSYGFDDLSGALDQNVPELTSRNDILRFETAPFTEPTEITGRLEAQLYVSTDVEDTTFMVKLIDIYPAEGTNTEYHAIMRESAIMGRYWGGLTNPAPMVSGTVYRLDIDMSSIALMVETNHRIAVHVTSSSDKAFEVHPNTYEPVSSYDSSPTARNTLYLSSQYPSRIILPLYTTNAPAIETSTSSVAVQEGGIVPFDVWMSGPSLNTVTLTVARVSGDSDITVSSGTPLVFTSNNWSAAQTVTLSATQDTDATDGSAIVEISSDGIVSKTVAATEIDDDVGIVASPAFLAVDEGRSSTLNLTLNRPPASDVTVTVARTSGDTDLSVSGNTVFIFTSNDWNLAQTVTITATDDADQFAGSAVFTCSSPDAISTSFTVEKVENDYTVVASGLLAAWDLQTVPASPVVTTTNACFLATGLVYSATGGVLTHSHPERMVGRANAVAANFTAGYASLDAALTAGYYFTWTLEPEEGCVITITNVSMVTDHENAAITSVLFSDASGLTPSNELGRMGASLQHSSFDTSGRIENIAGPVKFRLYGYGDSSQYHAAIIGDMYSTQVENDIAVYGTIVRTGNNPPAPPPASAVTLGSTGTGLDVIGWTTAQGSGHVYSVWYSTNLLEGFQPLETNLPDTAQSWTNPNSASPVFYQIKAQ